LFAYQVGHGGADAISLLEYLSGPA
jgi:hypothetical protein